MVAVREQENIGRLPLMLGVCELQVANRKPGETACAGAVPRSAPLAALRHSDLAQRFHSWHGRSGRRYICSIFACAEEAFSFDNAVAIAVVLDVAGRRHALAAMQTGNGAGSASCGFASRSGGLEWHVHLLKDGIVAAQAVFDDLVV